MTRGRPRSHAAPRQDDTGRQLATRVLVAYVTNRHPDVVRKRCPVVACDVATRAGLVDMADSEQRLAVTARRAAYLTGQPA